MIRAGNKPAPYVYYLIMITYLDIVIVRESRRLPLRYALKVKTTELPEKFPQQSERVPLGPTVAVDPATVNVTRSALETDHDAVSHSP